MDSLVGEVLLQVCQLTNVRSDRRVFWILYDCPESAHPAVQSSLHFLVGETSRGMIWVIISLLHRIGYPLVVYSRIDVVPEELLTEDTTMSIRESILQRDERWATPLIENRRPGLPSAGSSLIHHHNCKMQMIGRGINRPKD